MYSIATKEHPVRCSKLADIVKCSGKIAMMKALFGDEDGEGDTPAQTGSLTHAGVAAFHKCEGQLDERMKAAWDAIASHAELFPLADTDEVRLFITPYMRDPRNIHAKFALGKDGERLIESQINFTIAPHELDPTKELIHVQGTRDQVRIVNGLKKVYDLKTGRKTGWEMLHDYNIQLAAYSFGSKLTDCQDIQPNGVIIRNHGYRTRTVISTEPEGVFFTCLTPTWESVDAALEPVRLKIALMRMGYVDFSTGPHCTYCEFGGFAGCQQKFNELIQLGKM